MASIFLREILVIGRRRAFAVAAFVNLAIPALFVVGWPTGIPLGAGTSVLRQLQFVQAFTSAGLVTWIVCRCGTRTRGNDLVRLALAAAVPPSRIVIARFLALVSLVALMTLSGLPFVVLAREVAGGSALDVVRVEVGLLAAGTIGAACALGAEQMIRSYARRWIVAWVAAEGSLGLVAASDAVSPALLLLTAGAIAAIAWLGARADTVWRYLAEDEL